MDWSFWLGKGVKNSCFSSPWWTERDKDVFCWKLHLVSLQQINLLKDSFVVFFSVKYNPFSSIILPVSSSKSGGREPELIRDLLRRLVGRIRMERHMEAMTPSTVKSSGWKVYHIFDFSVKYKRHMSGNLGEVLVVFVHFFYQKINKDLSFTDIYFKTRKIVFSWHLQPPCIFIKLYLCANNL